MDCKPLASPMVPNLKSHAYLDFNPLVYRYLIQSLINLVSSRLD
jgi:hypothetical protein